MLHHGSTAWAIAYTLHISVFIHPPIWRFNVDKVYRHFLPLCVIFADTSTLQIIKVALCIYYSQVACLLFDVYIFSFCRGAVWKSSTLERHEGKSIWSKHSSLIWSSLHTGFPWFPTAMDQHFCRWVRSCMGPTSSLSSITKPVCSTASTTRAADSTAISLISGEVLVEGRYENHHGEMRPTSQHHHKIQ